MSDSNVTNAAVFWHCFVASLGDGVIVLLIVVVGWISFQRWEWFERPAVAGYLLMLLAGLILAVLVEWVGVHRLARWEYTDKMPIIPWVGIGLIPVAQMVILPPVIFRTAALWLSSKRCQMLIIEITLSGIFCLDNASKEMLWPRAVVARWSKRLDLMLERSNNLSTMRRRSKNVVAYVLAAFFAFGILCSALAAPGQALASVSGCSQMLGGMAMTGCEHPSYLCGFDTGSNLFSSGALTSARLSDSLKNALGLALDAPSIDVSGNFAPPGARQWKKVSLTEPGKVSIRLFNSTLNL